MAAASFLLSPFLRAWPRVAQRSLGASELELELLDDAAGLVLYQGDSVVGWGADQRETTLPALISEHARLPLMDVSHAAYGPRLFVAQLRYLERRGIAPSGHLVGLSLASLGPFREGYPAWRFGARAFALTHGWELPVRGAAVLKHRFGALSDEEFARIPLRSGDGVVGTLGELTPRPDRAEPPRDDPARLRLALLAAYGRPLAESEQLPELRVLFATLARSGRQHLVYLTPFDHELAARHLDGPERARIQANRAELARFAAEAGVRYLDLGAELSSADFDAAHGAPTEHLNATGRRDLAVLLVRALRETR
ncbi:MAG: hypothetical protein AB7N76_01940 [Planctomycetota bacterium]